MIVDDQSEVIAFLDQPQSFASGITELQRLDTHGAAIFLAGDYAYKMKRAVYFEYMDFSTLARRHECCLAEVRLNARTAPEIYLGIKAVTRQADGTLALDGAGESVEWLVFMRRFAQRDILDKVALRGEFDEDLALRVADMACDFFSLAKIHMDADASDSIPDIVAETARLLPEGIGSIYSQAEVDALCDRQHETSQELLTPLTQRRRDGFVRHCHGDFHLRNICLYKGEPTLFDAIEFNDRLAISDVLYDLSFLLMDLLHRDLREPANQILNRYLERTGDYDGIPLLRLYLSVRAGIRAFTAIPAALSQPDEEVAQRISRDAKNYLALASDFLEPPAPRLVAIGGLSGSGKSTQAIRLAPMLGAAPGAVILRSDVVRKSLMGVAAFAPLGATGYSAEVTTQVYEFLRSTTAMLLSAGHSVIVDAVHARAEERQLIEDVATRSGVPFKGLWLAPPGDVMETRLEARRNDASDATVEILHQQQSYDLGEMTWIEISSTGDQDETAAAISNRV
jgi:uncharacterized protein